MKYLYLCALKAALPLNIVHPSESYNLFWKWVEFQWKADNTQGDHDSHLDSAITRCRNNIFVVKIYNINGSTMSDQYTTYVDFSWGYHIPNRDRPIFRAEISRFTTSHFSIRTRRTILRHCCFLINVKKVGISRKGKRKAFILSHTIFSFLK